VKSGIKSATKSSTYSFSLFRKKVLAELHDIPTS
jgi:hypothetical protein